MVGYKRVPMLEILEISLICQNVKKQSIFKKNSISIIFFFSVVILYTVQFRWRKYLIGRMLHLFFHLYKRRITANYSKYI